MNKSISLSIPRPCEEQWSSFAPTNTGGFCGSCQKNVIDFTKASDDEILAFIRKKPAHACGKFRPDQLKTYSLIHPVVVKPGFTVWKAGIVSLLLLLISKPTPAQIHNNKTSTEQIDQQTSRRKNWTNNFITVKGTVKSGEDNSPLPSVSVFQKGTINVTFTDSNGNFELTIDKRSGKTLNFSFIGYESSDVIIQEDNPEINILMITDTTVLGGMEITGEVATEQPYVEQPGFFKRIWRRIKSVF